MKYIATETLEPSWSKMVSSADEDGIIILTTNHVPVAIIRLYEMKGKKLLPTEPAPSVD